MARVTSPDGTPLKLECRSSARRSHFQVWRVDVGRVPLLLLDAELPENDAVQRWTSARLYEGNRAVRLAQYGLLGIGGARVLRGARDRAGRRPPERGPSRARARSSSQRRDRPRRRRATRRSRGPRATSSSPRTRPSPPATRPTRPRSSCRRTTTSRTARDRRRVVPRPLPRRPGRGGPPGMTPLAIRMSRSPQRRQPAARRGRARDVAAALPGRRRAADHARHERRAPADVRLASRCGASSTSTSATRWLRRPRPARPGRASARSRTPSSGRRAARRGAPRRVPARRRARRTACCAASSSTTCALIESSLDPDSLTIGFARRLATYKRFHLLSHDPDRTRRIFGGDQPAQLVIAGKAHPNDEPGKDALQRFYNFEHDDAADRRPRRDRRGLRHRHRAAARLGLRRLGQPAAQADGGERDERHEGDLQRRAAAERPRRLVGRGLQRRRTAGRSRARSTRTRRRRRTATPRSSTTCSSTR